MKIIAFADVHYFDGDISRAIFNTRKKLVKYALPLFDNLVKRINDDHLADLAVNLGDIIQDTVDRERDMKALLHMFSRLSEINCPCYSVLGNHDLKMMNSVSEVEEALGVESFTHSIDKCGFHLVFLTTEVRCELGTARGGCYKAQYLSQEALDWLREDLSTTELPTLIFTHYGIAENAEIDDECMFMKNRRELKDIMEASGKVKAVFSGHQHISGHIVENNIDYYHIGSLINSANSDGIPDAQYYELDASEGEVRVTLRQIPFEQVCPRKDMEMNITGAIFDMDGTLVDSLGFWDILWKTLGEKYFNDPTFRPDPVTEKGVRTVTLRSCAELLYKNCGIGESAEDLFLSIEEMLLDFYKESVPLKNGVLEFLEHLKKKNVKMCIASATASDLIKILMDKFDLYRYFDRVFSCNEVGKGKEHPDVFILANEYLGTDKESTWIFEDSVVAIETVVKAGYKTVGIYDKNNFGLDRVKEISTIYIDKDDSLRTIIPIIK